MQRIVFVTVIAAFAVLSGCSNSNEYAQLRVIHASPDAPEVNIMAGNKTLATRLDYAHSTNFIDVATGTRDITVEAITPSGNIDVITVNNFSFQKNSDYTVLAVNNTANIEALLANDSSATPGASEVAVNVVHASPDASMVDVYVTAPGVDINSVSANFSFDFKGAVDAGALPATSYQIRVTGAGSKTPVYDSGTVDLTAFAGQKLLLAAISSPNSIQQLASPVQILVATANASLVIPDVNTKAGARVVHLSPDAGTAAGGAVEVFATSSALTVSPLELIPAFEYTDIIPSGGSSYVDVPAGEYIFDVAPDTDSIGDSVYTSPGLTLGAGSEYTVIAAGLVSASPAFSLLATQDNNRPVVTQASVKVVHAAPAAGNVDVYVTPAGAYTVSQVENGAAGSPLLNDFAFASITDYVQLAPGDYDIRVVAGGTTAINVEGFNLSAGSVSTVIARQADDDGTPADFNLVVLSN